MRVIYLLFAIVLMASAAQAAINLEVVAFTCNPDEIVSNDQFSCTATVQNTGDTAGSLNTATLYPDSSNWLENSNYPETSNANINSGASAEVVFSGLKAKKSGDNGYARILLDDVTDTYVADNAVTVNAIDVLVTESNSASSAVPSANVDVTGQAVVGGNVDTTLTFSVTSGDCSIGNQVSSATTNEMSDGQSTSHTWTVTTGTSDCVYSISAKATSNPSASASKTDTVSDTITCSGDDCTADSTDSSSSSSSGSSGGGGGGSGGGVAANVTKKTQCDDGTDNDADGLIDLKDPGCQSSEDDNEVDPTACTQSWECDGWGECDGKQVRTCTDVNNCLDKQVQGLVSQLIRSDRPQEERSCESEINDEDDGFVIELPEEIPEIIRENPLIIVLVLIGIGILGYFYYHGHHHVKKVLDYKHKR